MVEIIVRTNDSDSNKECTNHDDKNLHDMPKVYSDWYKMLYYYTCMYLFLIITCHFLLYAWFMIAWSNSTKAMYTRKKFSSPLGCWTKVRKYTHVTIFHIASVYIIVVIIICLQFKLKPWF